MILLSASPAGSTGSAVALRRFGKIAEATEFFVALFQQLIDRDFQEALQVSAKCVAQNLSGLLVIAMRAAFRLRHDFIHHAESHQVLRGQLQRFGRFRRRACDPSTKSRNRLPG